MTSTTEHTGLRCKLGPAYHRLTQKQNTFFDSDCVGVEGGDISLLQGVDKVTYKIQYYFDFKRQNNATVHNTQHISNKYFAVRAQIAKANRDEVPFFLVLTYLSWEYKDKPMYYLLPMNKFARNFTKKRQLDPNEEIQGFWLTLKMYSQFIAKIKGTEWKPTEEIDKKARWCEDCHISDSDSFQQKDLPNEYIEYALPDIELIQFNQSELKALGEI